MAKVLSLPPELILEISDYLAPDSILALKLTHRVLNYTLPALPRLKNRTLSDCARFAIERYRASSNTKPSRLRCILCKQIYPANMFISSSSPACIPLSFVAGATRPEIVDLPRYFCAWHVSRLTHVIRTEPGGRNEWVSSMKRVCMHGGCIEGWDRCTCQCDSCGYKSIRTYTRYLNNNTEHQNFKFWRNPVAGESADPSEKSKGLLCVKETCLVRGESLHTDAQVDIEFKWRALWSRRLTRADAAREQRIVDFPVRYEDVGSLDRERDTQERGGPSVPRRNAKGSPDFVGPTSADQLSARRRHQPHQVQMLVYSIVVGLLFILWWLYHFF